MCKNKGHFFFWPKINDLVDKERIYSLFCTIVYFITIINHHDRIIPHTNSHISSSVKKSRYTLSEFFSCLFERESLKRYFFFVPGFGLDFIEKILHGITCGINNDRNICLCTVTINQSISFLVCYLPAK